MPEPNRNKLSFCGTSPKHVKTWLEKLPKANIGECARQLYGGLQEVNALKVDASTRFQMLEVMRPVVYFIRDGLKRHYLNQPVILPQKSARIASLAQSLLCHLSAGYKGVVVQVLNRGRTSDLSKLVPSAIHRATSDITAIIHICLQLYMPTPNSLWHEIYQLHILCRRHGMGNVKIKDEVFSDKDVAVESAFQRIMLMGTAQTNQLTQVNVTDVFAIAGELSDLVGYSDIMHRDECFVVDLNGSEAPRCAQFNKESAGKSPHYIDCQGAVDYIEEHLQSKEKSSKGKNKNKDEQPLDKYKDELLHHLINTWSTNAQRTVMRTKTNKQVELISGFSTIHQCLSNGLSFQDLLRSPDDDGEASPFASLDNGDNRFMNDDKGDMWSQGGGGFGQGNPDHDIQYTGKVSAAKSEEEEVLSCRLLDQSPAGFCIALDSPNLKHLRVGDIVGIQESDNRSWSVGIIRWIRRFSEDSFGAGVEQLSSVAQSIGLKQVKKFGQESSFVRALLMPEIKSLGQPTTVLLANVDLREGMEVMIKHRGDQCAGKLGPRLAKTVSYAQYLFQVDDNQDDPDPPKGPSKPDLESEDDFDSLWSNIP